MYAAFNNHPACVKLLLEYGADLTLRNEDDYMAMDLAVGQGHKAGGSKLNLQEVLCWTVLWCNDLIVFSIDSTRYKCFIISIQMPVQILVTSIRYLRFTMHGNINIDFL